MRPRSLELLLAVLTALGAACAHAPAKTGEKAAVAEKVFVTGSHIRQRVEPGSGELRTTYNVRVYNREQLDSTGRQGDLSSALRALDSSVSISP